MLDTVVNQTVASGKPGCMISGVAECLSCGNTLALNIKDGSSPLIIKFEDMDNFPRNTPVKSFCVMLIHLAALYPITILRAYRSPNPDAIARIIRGYTGRTYTCSSLIPPVSESEFEEDSVDPEAVDRLESAEIAGFPLLTDRYGYRDRQAIEAGFLCDIMTAAKELRTQLKILHESFANMRDESPLEPCWIGNLELYLPKDLGPEFTSAAWTVETVNKFWNVWNASTSRVATESCNKCGSYKETV